MAQRQFLFTQAGLSKVEAELESLRSTRRQEIASRINRAKEGGTENNAEYDDARDAQAFIEGRVLTLETQLKNAVIIAEETARPDRVKLGSRVTLYNQDRKLEFFTIVGSAEASPNDGKISNESPVGKALLGRKKGSVVEVHVPAGKLKLVITDIS
ncbi:MAG: transcription elongation factor GreA [Dehalococcoidia bacterium]|nr:transcription elongation factor GreA [Dehalococcoidia bacterium]